MTTNFLSHIKIVSLQSSNDGNKNGTTCYHRDPRVKPADSARCSLYNTMGNLDDVWKAQDLTSQLLPTSLVVLGNSLSSSVLSATLPLQQSFLKGVCEHLPGFQICRMWTSPCVSCSVPRRRVCRTSTPTLEWTTTSASFPPSPRKS